MRPLTMSLILMTALAASPGIPHFNQAQAQSFQGCQSLRVDAPYAWLKQQASLNSPTLRTLPKGELVALLKRSNGKGYTAGGWWLVQTATGQRGFVHSSVSTCAGISAAATTVPGSFYRLPLHQCISVRVSAPYAWLKAAPSLSSQTYRTAPRGEQLALVKDTNGYGNMSRGWWLVRSAMNRRYWIHQSVIHCAR